MSEGLHVFDGSHLIHEAVVDVAGDPCADGDVGYPFAQRKEFDAVNDEVYF
ncbi:MAG: hypothetical protein WC299_05110 [Kiritimatiellia bacterium]